MIGLLALRVIETNPDVFCYWTPVGIWHSGFLIDSTQLLLSLALSKRACSGWLLSFSDSLKEVEVMQSSKRQARRIYKVCWLIDVNTCSFWNYVRVVRFHNAKDSFQSCGPVEIGKTLMCLEFECLWLPVSTGVESLYMCRMYMLIIYCCFSRVLQCTFYRRQSWLVGVSASWLKSGWCAKAFTYINKYCCYRDANI